MNTCPYCENKNCLVNIGHLIDSSTTDTVTAGMGYNGEEGLSPAILWSNSSSRVAQRFAMPGLPGDVSAWNFIGWTLLCTPIIGYIIVSTFFSNIWDTSAESAKWGVFILFGLPFGLFPGMFAALGIQKIVFYLKHEQRRKYEWSYYYVREGTYCTRCGVAYDMYHAGSPEEFVSKKFDLSQYAQ
jgi:hypothetical protein